MTITFITGFRDREPGHVKRSLDSLQEQTNQDFQMIFIDYGSTSKNSLQIQGLLTNYPFCKYYYSDTRGWLWNRGAALNTGARLATTEYIFFTDIDIVYPSDFTEKASIQMGENVLLISDTVRVPKEFDDWENLKKGKSRNTFKSMRGQGIACCPRKIFEELGGLDEQFAFWSNEDNDLVQRMMRIGMKKLVSDELTSYHQWHPRISIDTPYTLMFHNMSHYYQGSIDRTIHANVGREWGKLFTYEYRSIYQYVDPENSNLKATDKILFREAYHISDIYRWASEMENSEDMVWAFPENKEVGTTTLLINRVLRRMGWKMDRSLTYLDDFAQGLVLSVPGLFQDYYLGCNRGSAQKYSVFLK